MKKIGGFFELEINSGQNNFHEHAVKLTTGRSCLNHILEIEKYNLVYVPYYCCDALLEPLQIKNIEYQFYSINKELEIESLPALKENEAIIYCDFFGVKPKYVDLLIKKFQDQLIVDNTHKFFHKGYDGKAYSFTSARKYFGVPDGAFLYVKEGVSSKKPENRNKRISLDHSSLNLMERQDEAYVKFQEYEKTLGSEVEQISLVSEMLLSHVDYTDVRSVRNENFEFFRESFKKINELKIDEDATDCFCYPLLLKNSINRSMLFKENIFVPNYWMDTVKREGSEKYEWECELSKEVLPLPVDHRYKREDLGRVVKTILNLYND